jgi:hypothetical protein
MLAWSIALLLIAGCATVGFYVGAVRVGITTLFLLLGLFFLKPLTALGAKVAPILGVSHPGVQIVLGALLAFLLIEVLGKSIARGIQPMMDKYFKYDASDTQRLLFERLNQRTGPALGIVNALLYFIFISIAGLELVTPRCSSLAGLSATGLFRILSTVWPGPCSREACRRW